MVDHFGYVVRDTHLIGGRLELGFTSTNLGRIC